MWMVDILPIIKTLLLQKNVFNLSLQYYQGISKINQCLYQVFYTHMTKRQVIPKQLNSQCATTKETIAPF